MDQITPGRIVLYKLRPADVAIITAERATDPTHRRGNVPMPGDVVPLIVVRVWPDGVNGQAILDGNDSLWVTSARQGDADGQWAWPHRA
ncbi:hypothetical protein RS84_00241 [Microbacterium hydrocarbonoxydans]|uniref:Uncharacterized protein n=1 Tax=Microbacterium hydrocarbonoxydans TaxID=273678 RepID=A0A0M2HYK7_9MICO|nr:hypothetical protein [Microbacterium hydrocarbonoxydans]KJL49528.1 hypothetical protein RS84_00241 [Microbacterium hydrocarbonoxydans]